MLQDTLETKAVMEELIAAEIRRLIARADLCVFTLYDPKAVDPGAPEDGPIDYRFQQRCPRRGTLGMPVDFDFEGKIGRASCRERVCQYVSITVVAVSLKTEKL